MTRVTLTDLVRDFDFLVVERTWSELDVTPMIWKMPQVCGGGQAGR